MTRPTVNLLNDVLLRTAVKMAEVKHPQRNEATLGEIALRLGELGEVHLLRSLNYHRARFQECLRMAE